MRQATPSTLEDNTISIQFKTRAALETGTTLSISGLVGSLTPSGPINITGNASAVFGGVGEAWASGEWRQVQLHPEP